MNLLSRFASDRSGNFAIIFAICIVPIFGAAGLAVDYSRMHSAKVQLQQAADAAVLAAINEAQARIADGQTQQSAMKSGEAFGRAMFASSVAPISDQISSVTFDMALTTGDGIIKGDGTASGKIAGTLSKVIGVDNSALSVTSKAQVGQSKYLQVHILVDNSMSMGIGATERDQEISTQRTGCAFACHAVSWHKNYYNSLPEVRAAGAKLRIDVVKEAVGRMLDEFVAAGASGNRLQVALHTFANSFTTEVAATTDLNLVRSSLARIDLNGKDIVGAGTDTTGALATLEQRIGNSGNGYGPDDRQIIVLLVTDGVATNIAFDSTTEAGFVPNPNFTTYLPQHSGSQGFNPRDCDRLKVQRKVTMTTLNVRYLIPKVGHNGDTRFPEIEAFLLPDIEAHMRECASDPSLAMWADTPESILAVVKKLVTEITGSNPRLTL